MKHKGWSNYHTWCLWVEITNIAPNYHKVKKYKTMLQKAPEDKFKEFMEENMNFLVKMHWDKINIKEIQKKLSTFDRI